MTDPVKAYVAGLPEASGTFTGTYNPDNLAVVKLLGSTADLLPVEISTGDQPNPAALPLTEITIRIDDQAWTLPVDHVDLLPGGNRVRVWVRRPGTWSTRP